MAERMVFALRTDAKTLPRIDLKATGKNIRRLMEESGLTPSDIQDAMCFTSVQAIYKWFYGKNMPTLDNLVILAQMFGVTIDNIVVVKRGADDGRKSESWSWERLS